MRHEGFSLVEISIVLVVVATMLAGVLPAITEGTKVRDIDTTAERLAAIEKSIQAHFADNGDLPCPSDITLKIDVAGFGVEGAGADCRTGSPQANWSHASNVVGGGVPTKTIGLPDEYAFDGWGRRIYYHVDSRATDSATFDSAGAIQVNDGSGSPRTSTAVYALVSAGRNGHGAYTRAGGTVRLNTGSENNDEGNNCSTGTPTCVMPIAQTYNNILVQKLESATNPGNPLTNFDDIVTYKLRGHLLTGGGDTLWAANGNDIVNTNVGNVGIGTTAPSSKLTVAGDAGNASSAFGGGVPLLRLEGDQANFSEPSMEFVEQTNAPIASIAAKNISSGAGDLIFSTRQIGQPALSEKVRMKDNGNVGIGTDVPTEQLHVSGAAGVNAGIRISSNAGFTNNVLKVINGPNGGLQIQNGPGDPMLIFDNTNRNVGVGATSLNANSKLEVAGDVVSALGAIGQFRAVQGNYGTILRNDGSETYLLVTAPGDPYGYWNGLRPFTMSNANGNVALGNGAMYVFHGGNVGIGTGGPGAKLDVYQGAATQSAIQGTYAGGGTSHFGVSAYASGTWTGLARADGYSLVGSGHLYSGGNIYGAAFFYISDERLKTNIRPVEGLDLVSKLTGVRFDWKKNGKPSMGLIAQAVEKVLPELVTEDMEGNKRVDYGLLVAPLIEAVKQLKALIEQTGETIAALIQVDQRHDRELEALNERIDALELRVSHCEGAR